MRWGLSQYLLLAVVVLTLGSAVLTYMVVQEKTARKALQASHKILETHFAAQQQELKTEFEALSQEIEFQNKHISNVQVELARLEATKNTFKQKHDEKATRIKRIGTVDSLQRTIAKRYPAR